MIPIVFITDENFIMQTGVAITSLINNKNADTVYDIYVVAAECSQDKKNELYLIELNGSKINIIDASLAKYTDIKQLAHIPISCLLKFEICDMITNYDKIIYLDGDLYVKGDISELYSIDMGANYIAGVPSIEMAYSDKKMINAGIMLFNAKKMREDGMSTKLIEVRRGLGDRGSMDQQTFNLVMKDRTGILPLKYNYIPDKIVGAEKNKYPLEVINRIYGTNYKKKSEIVDDAVIIHFATGTKPWKYTFVPCGEKWYDCYKNSVFQKYSIKRKTRIQAHATGLIRTVKEKGIVGVVNRAVDVVMTRLGFGRGNSDWG